MLIKKEQINNSICKQRSEKRKFCSTSSELLSFGGAPKAVTLNSHNLPEVLFHLSGLKMGTNRSQWKVPTSTEIQIYACVSLWGGWQEY